MSNEIVKYHNDMASVSFKDFSLQEKKIYYAVCSTVKGMGTQEVDIYIEDLKELSGFLSNDNKRFLDYLDFLTDKLMSLRIRQSNEKGEFNKFVLFPKFQTKDIEDKEKARLTVKVSEDFAYILNSEPEMVPEGIHSLLNAGYTNFRLEEHNKLKSVYSSALFTHLKRFKRTGWWHVSLAEFRRLLDVPKSYRMPDIRRRVINPSVSELEEFFEDLKVEEIVGKNGQTVKELRFTFKKQIEKTVWHENDTFGELQEKYRCPYCKDKLYAIIKYNGEVFYGHRDGWKDTAPCRQTFGSLEEILGKNGDAAVTDNDNEKELTDSPKIERSGFNCRECGRPLFKIYNERGEMFYGHIDGWKKDAVCRKTYSSVAEIRGYSETPTRSDHADYELAEKGSPEASSVQSVFETISDILKEKEPSGE